MNKNQREKVEQQIEFLLSEMVGKEDQDVYLTFPTPARASGFRILFYKYRSELKKKAEGLVVLDYEPRINYEDLKDLCLNWERKSNELSISRGITKDVGFVAKVKKPMNQAFKEKEREEAKKNIEKRLTKAEIQACEDRFRYLERTFNPEVGYDDLADPPHFDDWLFATKPDSELARYIKECLNLD